MKSPLKGYIFFLSFPPQELRREGAAKRNRWAEKGRERVMRVSFDMKERRQN